MMERNNTLGWGATMVCIMIAFISSQICEGFIHPAYYAASRQSTRHLTINHYYRWYPPPEHISWSTSVQLIDGRYPTQHMMVSSGFSFSDGEQILVSLQSEYIVCDMCE